MISVICTHVWRMATKSWRDWPCRRLHCTRPDAEVLTFCRVRWNPRGVACRSRIWQVQLPRCYSRCPNDREEMEVTHVTELRSQSSPHRLAMPTQQLCCRSWARLEKSSLRTCQRVWHRMKLMNLTQGSCASWHKPCLCAKDSDRFADPVSHQKNGHGNQTKFVQFWIFWMIKHPLVYKLGTCRYYKDL